MQVLLIIRILITCLGLSLGKVGVLAKMLGLQLSLKGLVRGLGVDGLLLEDGEDSHGLLEEVDALGQVHAEVDGLPLDALAHVLLLLQHEHVVVEELLQLLVDKVDHELLKDVQLEDLEPGDVEHTDEVDLKWVGG